MILSYGVCSVSYSLVNRDKLDIGHAGHCHPPWKGLPLLEVRFDHNFFTARGTDLPSGGSRLTAYSVALSQEAVVQVPPNSIRTS